MMKPPQNLPRQHNYQSDYGTPSYILDAVLASLDANSWTLDLCSSAEHNERIGATYFYSADCPYSKINELTAWPPYPLDVVWCNPPGGNWRAHFNLWTRCAESGAYLAYSVDQLRGINLRITDCLVLLHKRVRYLLPNGEPAKSTAPCPSALIVRGACRYRPLYQIGAVYQLMEPHR